MILTFFIIFGASSLICYILPRWVWPYSANDANDAQVKEMSTKYYRWELWGWNSRNSRKRAHPMASLVLVHIAANFAFPQLHVMPKLVVGIPHAGPAGSVQRPQAISSTLSCSQPRLFSLSVLANWIEFAHFIVKGLMLIFKLWKRYFLNLLILFCQNHATMIIAMI